MISIQRRLLIDVSKFLMFQLIASFLNDCDYILIDKKEDFRR